MAASKKPTLSDIYLKLGQHDEVLKQIHAQVKATNGRVTALENKENNRAAVEAYIDKEGLKTPSEEKDGWTTREKALVSIIMGILAVASAAVAGLVK